MAADLRVFPLPDVLDYQEGPGVMAADFRAAGIPLIRLKGLETGNSLLEGCNFLDPEKVAAKWKHFQLELGDVLLSSSATLGRTSIVDQSAVGSIAYTGIIRFRPKGNEITPEYIPFLLQSPSFQEQAEQMGVGSVIRHFGPMHLRQMRVAIPRRDTQKCIAHILSTLDNKIELNRRMSATLEEMARAIFKSWFIDFDPVRAKAEGRPTNLPPEIDALFPDSFGDSGLGMIPDGWRIGSVSELADIGGGSTPSTKSPEFWDGEHAWATPKDLSKLTHPVLLQTERRITDAGLRSISSGLYPAGTVLMSSRAPIGYLAISEIPVAVNQGFIALRPKIENGSVFLLKWLETHMDEVHGRSNGSTFMEISKSAFRAIDTVLPPSSLIEAFGRLVQPMYVRLVGVVTESKALGCVRDTLLPKLISGEIEVPLSAIPD